ncbi:TAXI family TRAP transporter solute-binding subunit [Psychromarinibacter sp. C21-152]|uniref:TAXI family TRAP transporter solute-binding subunit n=1 Tax=Psychromarinibacter sediminicola TaxID=3033385 RepID=A0AAE3T7Y4_9RHOB|nr:TAXI family TRAP transporter solute-binding subunit [Psychromarinibacter sediminicola]MDF0600830.1 TAXI family TRAP transporter solute-binding subunit [Psychromarinibacter sediminicola]
MKPILQGLAATCIAAVAATGALAQANLTAETSSPGNSPHVSILHLAEIASANGIANLQVQEGQTLTNSLVNVAEGKTDITAMPLILPFLLNAGRGPFSSIGEERGAELASNVRALYPYNAGAFGLIALESEGIDSWEDLEGKNVWNGPPRGAALVNARQAIAGVTGFADGEDYTGHQSNWAQLATLLVDGSMDAFVVPLTFPSSRVTTMQAAGDVVIVSTPKDVFEGDAYQRLFNAPGNVPIVVAWEDMGYSDGVRLISEDATFRGLGTAFADLVHKDMPFDRAKALTTAYIESMEELKSKTPYAGNIGVGVLDPKLSGFCGVNPLKYHAGAVAAWEEAGYDVPDCAKPEAS